MMKRALRNLVVWACAVGVTIVLMAWVLPWVGSRGYAGEVIRANLRDGRDATALFYTESERTLEIVTQVEQEAAHARISRGGPASGK
jgi:hypothetical protein